MSNESILHLVTVAVLRFAETGVAVLIENALRVVRSTGSAVMTSRGLWASLLSMYTRATSTRSSLESGRAGDGGGGIGLAEASHVRKDDSMKTDDENSQLRIWTW
jgi:hypothetical protein